MNATELFASEWQSLNEKRQQLVSEVGQLKRKLNSLTTELEMSQLFEEKVQLRKKVPGLRDRVKFHKNESQHRQGFLERLRLALTDKQIQQELATQLKNRRNRLARLKKLAAPNVVLENAKRMVFEIEAPIKEVEKLYRQIDAEEEQMQQVTQRVLDETLTRIATIDEYYQKTRQYLEGAISKAEQNRRQCRINEIEWATQSRNHLEWMLKHEPSYKDDVFRRYKERFKTDSLTDLFPPILTPTPIIQKTNGKKRRSCASPLSPVVAEVVSAAPQPWRFWVTFNTNDLGQELPQERDQFLSTLQSALGKANYYSLGVGLVYDKLMKVSRMSMQQRQEMNKVVEAEPLGWKILRAGKKHRLFLLIDEEGRHIRFLPCQRKKSYSQH